MSFAACPRCHDEISVPLGVRPSARVRCPLCREEMQLSEVLDRLPPMLEVLDAEDAYAAPAAGWQTGGESTYAPAGVEGEYAMASAGSSAMGDMVSAATTTMPGVGASTNLRQRKQPSVVGEMIKIVLGGVTGIVLALAVLWYGFKKDPLNMGPTVAAYVPQIVPEQFQGKPKEKDTSVTPAPNPIRPSPPSNNSANNNTTPPAPKPNGDKPLDFGEAFNKNLPKPADPNEPVAAPAPNAGELGALFAAVQQANEAFTSTPADDKAERRRTGMELFNAFADTGAKLAGVDLSDPALAQMLPLAQEEMKQVAGRNTSMFGTLAVRQLDAEGDKLGVVLPLEVKDFKSAGKWFELTGDLLPKKDREVTVFVKQNPQDQTKIGDKVFILGAVEKDAKNLKGYRGNTAGGVLGGLIIVAE